MQVARSPANSERKKQKKTKYHCGDHLHDLWLHFHCLKFDLWRLWLACSPFRFSYHFCIETDKGGRNTFSRNDSWNDNCWVKREEKKRNLIVQISPETNIRLSYKRHRVSQQWFIAEFQSFSIHYSFQIVFKLSVEEKRPLGDAEMKIIFKYSCTLYLIIESVH